jgi:hypothetical protein
MYYPKQSGNSNFKGYFAFPATLPTPSVEGDYAIVGSTDTVWVWDTDTSAWVNSGGSIAGVTSFNARTGAVVPVTNDYTWAMVNKTVSSLADLTTRDAGDLASGNLALARMPSGGTWALSNTLSIAGGNLVFNSNSEDIDFTIKGLTDYAYTYDCGLDQHRWYGDTSNLAWTGGSGVFVIQDISGNSSQLGSNSLVMLHSIGHRSSLNTDTLEFYGAGKTLWCTFDAGAFEINRLAQNIDFVIKKPVSGDAYRYSWNGDSHKWYGTGTNKMAYTNESLSLYDDGFDSISITKNEIYLAINEDEHNLAITGDALSFTNWYASVKIQLENEALIINADGSEAYITVLNSAGNTSLEFNTYYNEWTCSSLVKSSMDLQFTVATKGIVLKDRTNSNNYRIYMSGGALLQEVA